MKSFDINAIAWRVSVEPCLRCQGLITVRQSQKPNMSSTFTKFWSRNYLGRKPTRHPVAILNSVASALLS